MNKTSCNICILEQLDQQASQMTKMHLFFISDYLLLIVYTIREQAAGAFGLFHEEKESSKGLF